MNERIVRIGFVQMAMSESREDNLRHTAKFVAEAAAEGRSPNSSATPSCHPQPYS